MNSCDTLVIGGGLSGCMAAITLAQQGRNVVLLEAGTYPRPKVCGEFFSPECAALFDSIGFMPSLNALHPNLIRTLRITAPDGTDWASMLPVPAISISRYALDAALAEYARQSGVDVRTETTVTHIAGNLREGFNVTGRSSGQDHAFRASSVIAAHGKRSGLDRVLNRPFFNQVQPYVGLKQHFSAMSMDEHLDLHVFPGGYCGMSQVEDGRTNVCLLVEQPVFQAAVSGIRRGEPSIDRFVTWIGEQNPQIGAALSGAVPLYPEWLSIGQVPLCAKSPLEGDVLMAGDAAGMIAPLAGDGMAMALHSGRLAAFAVERFLTGEQSGEVMLRTYAKVWEQHFRFRLRLGRTLQSILIRPRFLSLGLKVVRQLPGVGQWLVHHTRDYRLLEKNT